MRSELATRPPATPALIRALGLSKSYVQRAAFSSRKFTIEALLDVKFEIAAGSVAALIGESGSGKSTLARCLAMVEKPERGEIWFDGSRVSDASTRELAALRPKIQMVFQDSAGSLNPRFTAAEIVAEPLEIQRFGSSAQVHTRAGELMEEVGLSSSWSDRRPLELSGGQRQRLAIARAIALKPSFLILDEALSGLDLSTQAQILNLLLDLKRAHALTYLLISHDLSLVAQVADSIAVMQKGQLIEQGRCAEVLANPQHEHTLALVGSVQPVNAGSKAAYAGGRL